MILRRVTKHVTEQNWFAVFIDFLIVVVGVFIGIQVSNWNETRKEDAQEKDYLIRLYEDFEANVSGIQRDNDFLLVPTLRVVMHRVGCKWSLKQSLKLKTVSSSVDFVCVTKFIAMHYHAGAWEREICTKKGQSVPFFLLYSKSPVILVLRLL